MNSSTDAIARRARRWDTRHPRGHQQHRRPNTLAAAVLDVVPDRRDQRDLRLHVAGELALDLAKILANRLEQLRESGGGWFLRGGIQARSRSDHIRGAECQRASASNPCVSSWSYGTNSRVHGFGLPSHRRISLIAATLSAQLAIDFGHAHDVRRLVALSPMRNRREKRAVGLDEQSIERHHLGHFLQLDRPRKRDDAGERQVETDVETSFRHRAIAGETVEHAADLSSPLSTKDPNVSSSASRV